MCIYIKLTLVGMPSVIIMTMTSFIFLEENTFKSEVFNSLPMSTDICSIVM